MDLTTARGRLLALLADADGTAGWLDAVLDEALRRGLRSYSMQGPVDEVTVTVSASGYGLDIAGLQATTVYAVAPGWTDGVRLETAALPPAAWRVIGDGEIRADGYAFAVGEQVRIRFRRRAGEVVGGQVDGARSTGGRVEGDVELGELDPQRVHRRPLGVGGRRREALGELGPGVEVSALLAVVGADDGRGGQGEHAETEGYDG